MSKLYFVVNLRLPTEKANGYQIASMCKEYAALGHDVELIIPRRKNSIKKNVFEAYGLEKTFAVRKVGWVNLIGLSKYIGAFAYWINALMYLLSLCFVSFEKDSILCTRSPEIAWLAKKKGIVSVYECHDWFGKRKKLVLWLLKDIDLVVTTNNIIRENFISHSFPPSKVMCARNAVDVTLFDIPIQPEEARVKLGLPKDKKIVLYTGHLYERKGVNVLAEAAKILPDDYQVYFVGGTQEDIKIFSQKYASVLAINIVGHVPHSDVPVWLKAADVLVIPNTNTDLLGSVYTSPLKLFEYMASRRPIVASDLPAIREVVDNSMVTFFIPGDSKDLSTCIIKMCDSKKTSEEKRATKTQNAFKFVQENSWNERARSILKKLNQKI